MPHGLKFHLNLELTVFQIWKLFVLPLWILEQKFSDNGSCANYVFRYSGNGRFHFSFFLV